MKLAITIVLIAFTIVLCHENLKKHHNRKLAFRHETPQGLELYLNSTSGLVGLLNTTNHVAVVFDMSTSSLALFSGLGGSAVAIDGHSHTILKLSNSWSLSSSHFEQYFQSLSSLQEVISSGQAAQRPEVEPELSRLATQLGVESNALENLIGASATLHQVGGILKLMIGQDHFNVRGTLLRTVIVLKGVGDLFVAKPHDLEQLAKSGNHLDLPAVINAPNGLQALLRILQSLGTINMAPIMGNVFGSIDTILHIIVELGGNDSDDGIDNVLTIVYNIFAFINGHGCIDCLIEALIKAGENGGVEINGSDITPVIDDLLKLGEKQNSLFQTGGIFNVVIKFLRDLNSNNLFLNDINISELLQVLSKGDYRGAVDMIVRFFMHFNNMLNPTKSIPRFFGYFLTLLNGTRGSNLLPKFLPGVQPDQLQQLQGVNITNLFQNQGGNVPILGQIFKQFSSSVGNASNGSLNFTDLLNQSGGGAFQLPVFGRFAGFGLFQPLQSLNPFQGLLQGGLPGLGSASLPSLGGASVPFLDGSNIPIVGGANVTNILVNNSAPCANATESTTVQFTTLVENTTADDITTPQSLSKRRNHHGRKNLKHHNKHLKHHQKHESKHKGKSHGQSS